MKTEKTDDEVAAMSEVEACASDALWVRWWVLRLSRIRRG